MQRPICPKCQVPGGAHIYERGTDYLCPNCGDRLGADIIKLVPRENMPNASLIGMLERMLESARTGELDAVALGCSWADGSTSYGWSTAPSQNRMIAGISRLQHAYMAEAD